MSSNDSTLASRKSLLGKLLATEDITIEHRQVRGPFFDTEKRLLVLPIWKDTDADLYDLMIGHEVGHALYTPTEGWMEKVIERGSGYKQMLNLIEDARIEKKMKRRYPGLIKPMYAGYATLVTRGFFGMKLEEMKYLPFPDRLNVHFKLGARADVSFSPTEQEFVDRVRAAETWDEVELLADELYTLAQDEKNLLAEIFDQFEETTDEYEGAADGSAEGEWQEADEDTRNSSEIESAPDSAGEARENAPKRNFKESHSGSKVPDEDSALSDKLKNTIEDYLSQEDVSSITGESLEKNADRLIDDSARPIAYASLPILDTKMWVIPSAVTHLLMKREFSDEHMTMREDLYAKFMNNNKRYISYMVKEFELKRSAAQFAKARVSKTGELDINKVWRHRLSEDLFLQSTVVPNGKNHAMLMMIDLSGSMANNMAGTIEQLICMALFCRKVRIPFDVYGFTDGGSYMAEMALAGIPIHDPYITTKQKDSVRAKNDLRDNVLSLEHSWARLKQFLHWKMSASEFTDAIKNLVMLSDAFEIADAYRSRYASSPYNAHVPDSMRLGGTPLDEGVMILRNVAEKFKAATRVEVLNTIILTDGDSTGSLNYNVPGQDRAEHIPYDHNIVLKDERSKKQVKVPTRSRASISGSIIDLYRQATGSRVIGYYLSDSGRIRKDVLVRRAMETGFTYHEAHAKYTNEFVKSKYFGLKELGYDVYYILPANNLGVEEMTMDTLLEKANTKKGSKTTLYNAFKNMNKQKSVSRVFLNQFIKQLA